MYERADIVIAFDMYFFRAYSEVNMCTFYTINNAYVANLNHPIHQEPEPRRM